MNGHVSDNDVSDHAYDKPFRVIVAGGGVTGLVASHILSKAGIDHVVLERGKDPAPASGASIAIYPHGARILEQIGVLEAMQKINAPMDRLVHRWPNGSELMENEFWGEVKKNHGYDLLFFERREFLQTLYDELPDKSKILLGKEVIEVKESYNKVKVFLSDGTTEQADVLIGCDGVHSIVRQKMWDHADRISPGLITINERKAMMTSWTCLLGMGPGEPALRDELSATHDNGYSFLIGTQPSRTFFFVFFRVEKPYSQYKRPRWTEKDAEQAALKVADHPISENLVFGDIWRKRYRAQIVDIEEGMLSRWFFGRTVLVGDAAHKVTPNIALGGNSGMESIALLSNLLRKAVVAHPNVKPSRATLTKVFQQYQDQRIPRMKKIVEFSNLITRIQAWDGSFMKFAAVCVLPYLRGTRLGWEIGQIIKDAEKLDFVPIKSRPGRISWKDDEDQKGNGNLVVARKSNHLWKNSTMSGLFIFSSIILFVLRISPNILRVDAGIYGFNSS